MVDAARNAEKVVNKTLLRVDGGKGADNNNDDNDLEGVLSKDFLVAKTETSGEGLGQCRRVERPTATRDHAMQTVDKSKDATNMRNKIGNCDSFMVCGVVGMGGN
jgi:hypothetical protein